MQDKKEAARQADARDKTLAQSVFCEDADHLYLPGARDLIGRFLRAPFLDRRRITAIELLHSTDYQRSLIADSRVYQASVQNFSLAQVKGTDLSSAHRIKQIHRFIDDVMRKMVMLDQGAPVNGLKRQDCIDLVLKALGEPKSSARDTWIYRLITAYLKNCPSWIEKLELLIRLFEAVVQSNGTSSDRFVHCDTFLGDIMRSRAALDELLGEVRTLEDRLIDVVSLYRCDDELVARSKKKELLRNLFEISGKADLKATRAAFVYHIYAGLGARTDMASSDLLQEMQALGRVREKLRHDDS